MTAEQRERARERRRRRVMRTTAERGYGHAHQRLRAEMDPAVQAGEASCARCGRSIAPDGEMCPRCGKRECGWDLGHDDYDRSRYSGPEHACCNRATRKIWATINRDRALFGGETPITPHLSTR